jgi:hypothetical protein
MIRKVLPLVLLAFALPLAAQTVRQSDAIEILVGPYVDATDGVTAETGLTISQGDIILAKCTAAGDCAASAQKNDATACSHVANGMYECDLNTTDTDTVGILYYWSFESGAAPVFGKLAVVETAIYDGVFADSVGGLATAAAVDAVDNFVDTEITTIDDLIDTEIGTLQTSITAVDDFVDTEITTIDDLLDTEIADIRRAIGPATTTIATLASQTSFTLTAGSTLDNPHNGDAIIIVDNGATANFAKGIISDYTGATKTVTLLSDPGIFTMGVGDFVYTLPAFLTTGVDVLTIEGTDATDQLDAHAAAGLDAAGVRAAVGLASANLDTQLTNIDNFVDTEVAALVTTVDTVDNFLDTEMAAVLSNTDAILVDTSTTLDDFMDTEVAAILAAVDTETAAILADTDEVQTTLAAGGTIESLVDDLPAITTAVGTTIPAAVDAVDNFVDTEITALMNARTQIFPGNAEADSVLTADSGDTNTLVDTELTFTNAEDIDGVYVVRSDGQRCFVDSFVPATDTIEFGACAFTGAWSTQTYELYPADTQ